MEVPSSVLTVSRLSRSNTPFGGAVGFNEVGITLGTGGGVGPAPTVGEWAEPIGFALIDPNGVGGLTGGLGEATPRLGTPG